jgi:hypothetical protein
MSMQWIRQAIGIGVLVTTLTLPLRAQDAPGQGRPDAVGRGNESRQAGQGDTGRPSDRQAASPQNPSPADRPPTGGSKAISPAPAIGEPGSTRIQGAASGEVDPTAAVIQEPSQGRPIFITPGETFYFVMRLPPDVGGDVTFSLRHALEPDLRYPLRPSTPPSYNDQYCSLLLLVPQSTEPGLYDIEVKTQRGNYTSRRCVKVVDQFRNKFRFVHLSNMNVGGLMAPTFDEMLPREVNLLAPEFIIATGDYTEWARARDDASSWAAVLKFFEQFNAPVFMLCGAHDHEASFTRMVASKPVDKIDYGGYHGLLLLDHAGNPIDQDFSQIQWIENDLRRTRQKKFTFIVSNSDELGLLDIWREAGRLAEFIKEHKIKLMIAGGATDWDYREFADKLKDSGGVQFVRTHASSNAQGDGATGVSHYRVFDVEGEQVSYVYPDDNAVEKLQHSVPAGRLRVHYETPNDGTAPRVSATMQNALNQAFPDAHVWMRVAKGAGGNRPAVAGGRLVQAIDRGKYWACDVAADLPDKGAVRVTAAANPDALPPPLPIEVALDGPRDWAFTSQTTDFGLTYYTSDAPATLKLKNTGKSAIACWPVIRVNGSIIQPDRKACPRLPITLEPGNAVTLPLTLALRKVSPGRHALQVYFLEDPLARLQTFDVTLR